jgi:predicted TIM-barrel fold metal-dependent hydrolase
MVERSPQEEKMSRKEEGGWSLSRRQFLHGCAASGLVAAGGADSRADGAAREKPTGHWIDAHVHVWTPDTGAYPLAEGYTVEGMKPPSFTPEQLFEHCRPHGVGRIVLIQMSFYGFDNSYMLDMMKRHRGVFGGVAVIDENDQPARTMRRLARQGVRGFRIRPGDFQPGQWLDRPPMKAMWETGAKEGLAMCHLVNPEYLPEMDRMCEKYPETPVVIDHFARIGISGQVQEKDLDNLCRLARHRNVSVKVSAYYALGQKQAPYLDLLPMIRRLLDRFGPERLMWASDGPFQVVEGHEYGPSIDLVKEADFLSQGDRAWLLEKTAEKIFYH